jgi:uncharacterized protein YjbI with pentapeptide repeats
VRIISEEDLKEILVKHKRWLDSCGLEGKRAELNFVDFRENGCFLKGNNLTGADLCNSIFTGLDLSGTIFGFPPAIDTMREKNQGSRIVQITDLRKARFEDTILEGADLEGAKLGGTNLNGAENLTQKQIDSAITDENTVLPDYLE